jgi:hypothetical protein
MITKAVIPFTREELHRWFRILRSGARGTHLLFTNEMIREAFGRNFSDELLREKLREGKLQKAIAILFGGEDLAEKLSYLENLEPELRSIIIRMYFSLLDQFSRQHKPSPEALH